MRTLFHGCVLLALLSFVKTDTSAQWREVTGIARYGLRTLFTAGDGTVFAASTSRVYRSTDGGAFWEQAHMEGFPPGSLYWVIRQHPHVPNMLVGAATGMVLLSSDGGDHWLEWGEVAGCNAADVCPSTPGCFYINCGRASIDFGCTDGWHAVNNGIPSGYFGNLREIWSRQDGSALLYSLSASVLSTTNKGQQWLPADAGIEDKPVNYLYMPRDTAWVGTAGYGIYRSTDLGRSWQSVSGGLGDEGAPSMSIQRITHDSRGPLVAQTRGGVYASNDGATSWRRISNQTSQGRNDKAIAVDSLGRYYLLCEGDSVLVSDDDGANWTLRNAGMRLARLFGVRHVGGKIHALGEDCLYLDSESSSYAWYQPTYGLPNRHVVELVQCGDSKLFAFDSDGVVSARYPLLTEWQTVSTQLAGLHIECAVGLSDGVLWAGTRDGTICRTPDWGVTRQRSQPGSAGIPIREVLPVTDSLVFCATFGEGVFRSDDAGLTWLHLANGITHPNITDIITTTDGMLYAGSYGDGVFRSSNNGDSWDHLGAGMQGKYITSLVANSVGFIGAASFDAGVEYSPDQGRTWREHNRDLTDRRIIDLLINPASYEQLWAVTADGRLLQSVASLPTGVRQTPDPAIATIDVPVPHPFTSASTVSITLDNAANVELALHDVLGRKVRTIHSGHADVGTNVYSMSIAAGLPSGVYTLVLRGPGGTRMRAVTHLRTP